MSRNQRFEIEFPISGPEFQKGMAAVASLRSSPDRVIPFVRAHGELVEPFSPWAEQAEAIVYQIEPRAAACELRDAMLAQLKATGVTVRAA